MTRRLPSLNALRAFEAAARHGKMILAADELHVTHSAVSRQVKQLEAWLGEPLFEGPKHALRLTSAGQRLLPVLSSVFDQVDLALREIADDSEGPLDVSCLGTFTMRWLIPRLPRFQAAHPEITVRLTSSDAPIDFSRDSCNLAIRIGSGWPQGMEVVPLFEERFGPVLAPRLLAADPRDLNGIPRLHSRTRPEGWHDWIGLSGVSPTTPSELDYEHFYFMLEAATSGLGVCIAPWPHVADDVRAGRLAAPYGFIPSGQRYAALHRPRPRRRVERFCAWLREEAESFTSEMPPPG